MVEKKSKNSFDYQLGELVFGASLGEGAFGNVRVAWPKSNKSIMYAVKIMKKAEIISSKHVDHIENEKNILEKL